MYKKRKKRSEEYSLKETEHGRNSKETGTRGLRKGEQRSLRMK
jgi:hypothetical protein